MELPAFPLVVRYEDGEEEELASLDDAVTTLEWFDSDNPESEASVYDASGRRVRLKIEALKIIRFELLDQSQNTS